VGRGAGRPQARRHLVSGSVRTASLGALTPPCGGKAHGRIRAMLVKIGRRAAGRAGHFGGARRGSESRVVGRRFGAAGRTRL
jgi:hypothetical protein